MKPIIERRKRQLSAGTTLLSSNCFNKRSFFMPNVNNEKYLMFNDKTEGRFYRLNKKLFDSEYPKDLSDV